MIYPQSKGLEEQEDTGEIQDRSEVCPARTLPGPEVCKPAEPDH